MSAGKAVRLFATCLVEAVRPSVARAAVAVLERAGWTVSFPRAQTCCGQVAWNAGAEEDARAMAKRTIEALDGEDSPIVLPSGSCADMIVHHYPALFRGDAVWEPRAKRLAGMTWEFSDFLDRNAGGASVLSRGKGTMTFHPSCHLTRGLGVKDAPRRLLNRVAGATLVDLPEAGECCGFGGLFSLKMPAVSGEIVRRKCDAIVESGADTVVACDLSCLLQMEGAMARRSTGIRFRHLAQVLAPEEGRGS